MKLESFWVAKDIVIRMLYQLYTNRGLVSRIYKILKKKTEHQENNPIKEQGTELNSFQNLKLKWLRNTFKNVRHL